MAGSVKDTYYEILSKRERRRKRKRREREQRRSRELWDSTIEKLKAEVGVND